MSNARSKIIIDCSFLAKTFRYINIAGVTLFVLLQVVAGRAEKARRTVDDPFNFDNSIDSYVSDHLNDALIDLYIDGTPFAVRQEEKEKDPSIEADEVAEEIMKLMNTNRRTQIMDEMKSGKFNPEKYLSVFDDEYKAQFQKKMASELRGSFDSALITKRFTARRNFLLNQFSKKLNSDSVNKLFDQVIELVHSDNPNQGFWFSASLGVDVNSLKFMHHYQKALNISVDNVIYLGMYQEKQSFPFKVDALSFVCMAGNMIPSQTTPALIASEYLLSQSAYQKELFEENHPCVQLAASHLQIPHLKWIKDADYEDSFLRKEILYYALGTEELSRLAKRWRMNFATQVIKQELQLKDPTDDPFIYTQVYGRCVLEGKKKSADFILSFVEESLKAKDPEHQEDYLQSLSKMIHALKKTQGKTHPEINAAIYFLEVLQNQKKNQYSLPLIMTGLALFIGSLYYLHLKTSYISRGLNLFLPRRVHNNNHRNDPAHRPNNVAVVNR